MYGITPYPSCKRSLSYFVGHLFQEGLATSTVKGYLSAIRYTQIVLGLGDPKMSEMPQLDYYTKGLRKLRSGRQRSRLPNTPGILRKLHTSWKSFPNRFGATMLWAASCVRFFAFLRSGEIAAPSDSGYDAAVHLSSGDVRLDNISNPQYLEVCVEASKTDPFRQGVCLSWSFSVGKCSVYPLHPHTT